MGLALLYNGIHVRAGQELLTSTHDFFVTHDALQLKADRTGASLRKIRLYDDPAQARRVRPMVGLEIEGGWEAHRATLEEVREADLLIHVRNIAHPDREAQREDVEDVLPPNWTYDAGSATVGGCDDGRELLLRPVRPARL